MSDVAHEFSLQVGNGCENTASDDVAFDFGEPEFDLVQPRRVCGCEVEVNPRIQLHKLADRGGFVSRKIVQDDMDLLNSAAEGNNFLEERDEVAAGIASGGFAVKHERRFPSRWRIFRRRAVETHLTIWTKRFQWPRLRHIGKQLKTFFSTRQDACSKSGIACGYSRRVTCLGREGHCLFVEWPLTFS